MNQVDDRIRCDWGQNPHLIDYHDTEWGVPVHDDRLMFEFLALDGFQAGLSWEIILRKRAAFRSAFHNFEIEKVAGMGPRERARLAADKSIVRNKMKIKATIENARAVLELKSKGVGLCDFLWDFVDGRTIVNTWPEQSRIPAQTDLSVRISRELKKTGFKFVGPTIIYSVLQAAGLVNDHLVSCFRYRELIAE